MKKSLLGDMLIDEGLITVHQRDEALTQQKREGRRLGEILIRRGHVTEEMVARALSRQLGLEFRDLSHARVNSEVLKLVPLTVAQKHRTLPLDIVDGKLLLAMADPLDVFAMDEMKQLIRSRNLPGQEGQAITASQVYVAAETSLMKALDRYYADALGEAEPLVEEAPATGAEDTPVVRLVNEMMSQAVDDRASDIHIEPQAKAMRVRFRIDGMLHEAMKPNINLHAGVVSRIKILSGMDIAEKRVPQDGRFDTGIRGKQLDVRASTLPTMYGEKVVLRLLEKTTGLPNLEKLGFRDDSLDVYEKLIRRPYGFIIATGPTGCGKTTTMYSSLERINSIESNVITVEDPIEFNLKGISQVQVNPRAGLSFASGLRHILRQDPDIIMIGEIRDMETASIAMHSALTGHLVLSTLHTNESIGAIARLMDMGVEPYLITASLIAVVGQRLIRKICPHCKQSKKVREDIFEEIGISDEVEIFQGTGCTKCRHTGYMGREGLFELFVVSEKMKRLIVQKATESELRYEALREGFKSMRQEGLKKVVEGITTLDEVMRISTGVE